MPTVPDASTSKRILFWGYRNRLQLPLRKPLLQQWMPWSVLSSAELEFCESVENQTQANWAREHRDELACDAAIR